jgi:hypothetical protein
MPPVESQHAPAMPLCAGNHRSVGKSNWQISVAGFQRDDTLEITDIPVKTDLSIGEGCKKSSNPALAESLLDHECDFGQNGHWHNNHAFSGQKLDYLLMMTLTSID